MKLGQSVCLPGGRKCGDCSLNSGLYKAVERSKVTSARKTKEEMFKVEEYVMGKTEIIEEEEVTYALPVDEEPVRAFS